ncbi:NAD(+)/NADH kinase [Nonomuraea pusilla]|uniref:NAD(+)/NADH kinase n=1 Tax=Nonomuraea pusilla TaxID=46177 RepID=UPI0033218633
MTVTVGVVANPASGRDIRRLVTSASVFDNAEKANMIVRLMTGLGAAGVTRVLMMPTAASIVANVERRLRGGAGDLLPRLDYLDMPVEESAADTVLATRLLRAAGVAGIAVLGGDGTHRLVARHCGDVPLLALSTGTNNAFPRMGETTVGGLAFGLACSGRVPPEVACVRHPALAVDRGGRRDHEYALVDVAVSADPFVGSRAIWRPEEIGEICVSRADPAAVGLSAVAGLLGPAGVGVHVRLAPVESAGTVLTVALAPGLAVPVGVRSFSLLRPGDEVPLAPGEGCIALDGEREIERRAGERFAVRLVEGPRTVEVPAVMRYAAAHGLLRAGTEVVCP